MTITRWWKQYRCNHDWVRLDFLYGDEANRAGYRELWFCRKCGKLQKRGIL